MSSAPLFISRIAARTAAVVVALVGAIVLIGWAFDIALLKSIRPDFVSMKADSALCFLLAGIALLLLSSDGEATAIAGRPRAVANACAILVALIGLLTLIEYLSGRSLGIDQLLFSEAPGTVETSNPGRIALPSAINFLLIGAALLLLDWKTHRGFCPSELFALLIFLVALLPAVGYLYGVEALYNFTTTNTISLHSSVAFLVLAAGILLARPDRGWMAVFTGKSSGGLLLRQLAPAIVALMVLLGWARLWGEQRGLLSPEVGTALFVTIRIAIIGAVLFLFARALHNSDLERRRLEAMKDDFLKTVSHDFRSPLTGIKLAIGNLEGGVLGPLNEKQRNILSSLGRSTARMTRMTESLLTISRMESGTLAPSRRSVDPADLIGGTLGELIVQATARHLLLEAEVPEDLPAMSVDPDMIQEVLTNLVGNALRFAKTKVVVRVERRRMDVQINVTDDGPGIEPKQMGHLFTKGVHRGRPEADGYHGTGLGLVICKQMVELHGGRIWAEGVPEGGMRFSFTLPMEG